MCSCSARSTCLWCITTGCFVRGYPHFAFRRDYLERLRIFVHQSQSLHTAKYSAFSGSGQLGTFGKPSPWGRGGWVSESPKKALQMQGRKPETRVREEPVCAQSQLTVVQDVWELAGALVYDCRPYIRHSSTDRSTPPSSLSATPVEVIPEFCDSVQEPVVTPGFVGTLSDHPGTDVEDELEYVSRYR